MWLDRPIKFRRVAAPRIGEGKARPEGRGMQGPDGVTKADILIVDDDPDIAQALLDFLEHDGYRVDLAGTGSEALARSREQVYSAVILDLGLPDLDGLRRIKKAARSGPETSGHCADGLYDIRKNVRRRGAGRLCAVDQAV